MKPGLCKRGSKERPAPAGANPYFAQGRGMQKKYTLHMYAKRSGVVQLGLIRQKHADTNELERVAREAVEQVEGGETLIWDRLGGVVEHHIQLASITAQKRSHIQHA